METLKVLVVDDEAGMRMGVQRALKDFVVNLQDLHVEVNFEIDTAETGSQAVWKLGANHYDIMLLDHKLPDMTGLDILGSYEQPDEKILTIMITAYASLETAVSAIKRGAYDFLAKPFTPAELKSTVQKAAETITVARQARKLAQEKRQIRFQLISVVAHELKSPLNAVDAYLKLIKDQAAGDNPETYDMMLDRSRIRIEQMRKLISDLLDMTRIESGQTKRVFESIDLVEIAKTSIETSTPAASEKGITINLHAEAPVTMNGVRSELEIVMNNLVSNAVKYNRDNGSVDVTLSGSGNAVTIQVKDTGIGMTKEETAKLFGEFVRIKNAKTKDILGSGLGLSILKRITTMYNGKVIVDSEPDVGTTFTVTLPSDLTQEPEQGETQSAAE